ncbi:short-chain dehydrogenase/reductase family protein [Heterostelium album PN500]|uniref:Short-chain dehydrogenase/reductase family protein n=1 Tax=Heterostelium pallidum (strain ATCC 26659 / Pp 5 / PN500) TaxID=670386 RepID=D3B713_HETP5|nr:short-chain dehydrogenase/reductase family protein [Heterostelium album PN500]EFA82556.1 short-chain dehydrogenase/reductase family protein [Heterostelium album PN500]|eukprot:XP_020434673.1 short-chain dehydrogenase/reductase family protein [Heterostelium album PN500]
MSTLEIKSTDKVWYVTGASKGIGLAIVKKLLTYGFKVVGTSRDKQQLIDAVGTLGENDRFLAVTVDLVNEESVKQSLNDALSKFGRIDVVVNNAGFCISGALEENTDKDVRANFDTNVFSVFNVLRNVSPILRNQQSGYVFSISSVGALKGVLGHSTYCATKFALDGLTESYAQEVKPFGIKVTTVNLGSFRTGILGAEVYKPTKKIEAYKQVHGALDYIINQYSGKQTGDPSKILDILIRVYEAEGDDTMHLFVTPEANKLVVAKTELLLKDQKRWEEFTTKTEIESSAGGPSSQNVPDAIFSFVHELTEHYLINHRDLYWYKRPEVYRWDQLCDRPNQLVRYGYVDTFLERLNQYVEGGTMTYVVRDKYASCYYDALQTHNLEVLKSVIPRFNDLISKQDNVIVHAVFSGDLECVKYLSCNGYPPSNKAVNIALNRGNFPIIKYFIGELGLKNDQFMDIPCTRGNLEIVKYIHDNNAGCTASAVDIASSNGHLGIVEFLLQNRSEGFTREAVIKAASFGYFEIIKQLCTVRPDIVKETKIARAASDYAYENGYGEIYEYLLNFGKESELKEQDILGSYLENQYKQ